MKRTLTLLWRIMKFYAEGVSYWFRPQHFLMAARRGHLDRLATIYNMKRLDRWETDKSFRRRIAEICYSPMWRSAPQTPPSKA